ncbi:class I SAM-dependent RNA methyltransferase [Gordonia sp. X0973]|uniref:class I SAM-dependent RNA methyltransferase n=1 Tax=Gordonia sp. X0973 TaxID=2742602 RepID=UPI000F53A43A|nr:TRAM domain-containing protein [Gordonia sp. X0973]QKT07230.1 class I SAM-dependent RNA methyltransferase [Gordonia sp. X0973]
MTDTGAPPLRCEVTALAHGGAGVARVDGRVVFVSGALPGETVLAEVTDGSRPAFWRARVVDVLEPSPDRTPVSCPAAAAGAGCCDLAYATPAAIRRAKTTILTDALSRIGRLDPPAEVGIEPIDGGGSGHGWRIRARLGVGADGAVGFRAAHGERIVDGRCAALTAEMTAALAATDLAGVDPGSELLAVHDDAGAVHLAVRSPGSARPAPRARGRRQTRGKGARASAQRHRSLRPSAPDRVLAGAPVARYRVGAREWELPVGAFWQAHRGAAGTYAEVAREWLSRPMPPGPVWDLYGGAGVFAGSALDAGAGEVHVVDTEPDALSAARAVYSDGPVQLVRAAVSPAALADLPAPAAVILDPPRSGAGAAVMDAVCAAAPTVIVHVGCDPASFARDVGRAVAAGYRLADLRGFDAFPLTHHLEAMALLIRS